MPRTAISERLMNVISFLCGVIFANAVVAIIDKEYTMGLLMLATIVLSVLMKKFIDWDIE